MEIQLLGTPGVTHAGAPVKVAGRQRALLALLAVHAPQPVSVDRLADALWGGSLPRDPDNALHQRISALRKVVDPERSGGVLVAAGGAYALVVDDAQVDSRRFEALVIRARAALNAGEASTARRELDLGLALWRGPALHGLRDEAWAAEEATRLDELRLVASEDRAEAVLRLGEGAADLVPGLEDLVSRHPLRERLTELLVRALYAGGRQAEALDAYRRTAERLADELGVDPGPALRRVHQQVLDQDASLGGTPRPTAGPFVTVTGFVPRPASALVGRDEAVRRVVAQVATHRLVTLHGAAGVGKSRLALAVAHQVPSTPGGTWWVSLGAVPPGHAVAGTVASTLGLSGGLGTGRADHSGVVAAALQGLDLLLVLDDCDHLIGDVADLVARVLTEAPRVRVLVTSREPLGLPVERRLPVPPLPLPPAGPVRLAEVLDSPAVRLLVERARARVPDFTVTEETKDAAAAVAVRLDGLPLALELAASRLTVLSLPELATALADRFDVLRMRARGLAPRLRALRAAVDWSWELMGPDLRRAWCVLAVPCGPFDLPAARALLEAAGVDECPVDLLSDLVDRSVLTAETSVPGVRYCMLDTLRAYGRERLHELGTEKVVRDRHAVLVEEWLGDALGAADPAVFDADLDRLADRLHDARGALAWALEQGDRRRAQAIAGRMGWVWLLRGLAAEGLDWLGRATGRDAAALRADEVLPVAALWHVGLRASGASTDDPRPWADLAAEVVTDKPERAVVGMLGAVAELHAGRAAEATARLEAAVGDARKVGGWPLGLALLFRAQVERLSGQPVPAGQDAWEALELLTSAGADWARAYAIDLVVDDLLDRDRPGPARDLALEGLALCRHERFPALEARMLVQLGRAEHELADSDGAREHLRRAVEVASMTGDPVGLGHAHLTAGRLARRRGDRAEASAHLGEAVALLSGSPAGSHGAGEARAELAALLGAGGTQEVSRVAFAAGGCSEA